jgi:hypothetical protein
MNKSSLFNLHSWKIPRSNSIHFALRYDDTHKFVTEQVKEISSDY